jgi:GT2 family glycosyltransferase
VSGNPPRVSVLVLNLNGRQYLDDCLSSLQAQDYPDERFEIVVVDNGSTDGSLQFVREKFPRTRIVARASNGGFCAPYNVAVQSSDADFVALLNNDAKVDRYWLTELVSAARRHGAAAVASKILSWNGETIDFVGGLTSFVGHSWQVDFREPATREYTETPLLFPCAGSALFSRATFLDAGGFDEAFFAYFEDVDLGWRLNLFGERVVLAPRAITYHRIHGTSSKWALAQRVRLLERNALAMIYKNYETATLARVFPAAVALLLVRALTRSGIDTLTLDLSERAPDTVAVNPYLVSHLIGLEDFCSALPVLREKRKVVQRRRRRSDADILALFGDPFRLHERGGLYENVARTLIREFGIEEILTPSSPASSATRPSAVVRRPVEAARQAAEDQPIVSIVILTALGPTHLPECLDSLREQNYPVDRIEVIIVDNGSAEDPTPVVLSRFPSARVIRNAKNRGFAAGNNQGAAVATGKYLVFLNDDTRVAPDWLSTLLETSRRRHAAAVASYIVDWPGTTVDFVDSAVNFEGKGFQLQYGTPVQRLSLEEKALLFACGCAMLVERSVFDDVGGWDEETFAYYEDVELGWRLHLLGHEVWFAPGAVVHHKHHGTSGRWPEPPRMRLYERNSLRILYGLLGTESLIRALPAALLLAADRALLASGLSRAADAATGSGAGTTARPSPSQRVIDGIKAALRTRNVGRSTPVSIALQRIREQGILAFLRDVRRLSKVHESPSRRAAYLMERGGTPSTFDAQPEPIPIHAAAILSGIYGFLSDLPALAGRRADLQDRRLVSDGEIVRRFGSHWLTPSGAPLMAQHHSLHVTLVEEFGLADLLEERRQ